MIPRYNDLNGLFLNTFPIFIYIFFNSNDKSKDIFYPLHNHDSIKSRYNTRYNYIITQQSVISNLQPHTHTHTHTRARARAHTHTRTHISIT